ncbi:MAG: exostosin family protein [Isosphaeraceae bacterium]|nr:exostosin family protein [Isosphaeraceae bacterium]
MKWFVYPDLTTAQARRWQNRPGGNDLSIVRASQCFLGSLLAQVERTPDPGAATYFLVPTVLDLPSPGRVDGEVADLLSSLRWFSTAPERHVFFLLGDNARVPAPCRGSAVFMPSCSKTSGALSICYYADPPETAPGSIAASAIDVSFQGALTTGHGLRARVAEALRRCRTRRVVCRVTAGYFYRTYGREQQQALRTEYLDLIAQSRWVFCPRGDGLNSLRFFETLACGRLPILVADDTALPLEEEIPYGEFVVRVPEHRVEDWEIYLEAFAAAHPDLEYCSSLARNTFRQWFTTASLRRLVERSLICA